MKISLVIPVKNESNSLQALLRSISGQTRRPDEVIFVDAGSADNTRDIINGYDDKKLNIKVFSMPDAYPGTARNLGVEKSAFEFTAFTDAGIEVGKDWLYELANTLGKGGSCDVVYGAYVPRADTIFKQCLAMAFVPPAKNRTRFIASSLLKKSVWQEAGGFPDFRAAEDRIFMEKIEEKKFRVRYNPKAEVIWDIPSSPARTFRRFANHSYHDLTAGRARDWHLPVLRMYAVAFCLILLGLYVSAIFIFLAAVGYIFRVIRKIISNRKEPYFKLKNVPAYSIGVSFLIVLIDMAMFCGWVRYILRRG